MIIKYAAALAIGFYGTTYAIEQVETPSNETVIQKVIHSGPPKAAPRGRGWYFNPRAPEPEQSESQKATIIKLFCKFVEGPNYNGYLLDGARNRKEVGAMSMIPAWCRKKLGQEV